MFLCYIYIVRKKTAEAKLDKNGVISLMLTRATTFVFFPICKMCNFNAIEINEEVISRQTSQHWKTTQKGAGNVW